MFSYVSLMSLICHLLFSTCVFSSSVALVTAQSRILFKLRLTLILLYIISPYISNDVFGFIYTSLFLFCPFSFEFFLILLLSSASFK